MRWSCLSRSRTPQAAILKCLSCSPRLTPGSGGGTTRSGLNCGPGRYKNQNSRSERPVDGIKARSAVWRENANQLLLRGHFIVGVLENLRQNASPHLLRLLEAVNVQEGRRHVKH